MPKKRPPLTDEEGEVRELTREDFRSMRPIREVMPEFIDAMAEFRRKLGRPKAEAPKVHIGFRLAADVVASIKASGRGYNARVEQALRAAGFGAKRERRLSLGTVKTVGAEKKRPSPGQGTKRAVSKRRR
jgi:uncharacterized protein (DUF4415 family)